MRSLPSISIKRPVFAWMLMSSLIIFGGVSFMRLGISQLPDVDLPVISVSTSLPGAAPEVMETTVVDLIESAVMGIQGIKSISSTSRTGSATVAIELELERNIDLAIQEVQSKVAQIQRSFPINTEAPSVSKSNPEDQPILWLSASSKTMPKRDLMRLVRDEIRDQFTTVPGVAEVFVGGYVEPSLRVWVDERKLERYSLTVGDLIQTIQSEHAEPPAGRIQEGLRELNVRTLGEKSSAEGFRSLPITTRGGVPVFTRLLLGDVADVEEGLQDVRRIARANGVDALGLGIRKQRGSNAVEVARLVKEKMGKIQPLYGAESGLNVDLDVRFDHTTFIEESVHELNFHLVLAAILTSLVCWAFLGSWSSTFNILLSIPTSIIGTFIVLYFAGFTLNTFTLLGLSLAIGIVVDDAIMVLENILRHQAMGKDRRTAALEGTEEIYFAALAATISIVAIFLPVAFMTGVPGKFFFQFGVTMTVAVMLSLVEAITLTPMRASQMLKRDERTSRMGHAVDRFFEGLRLFYEQILRRSLQIPGRVLAATLILFVASLFVFKKIPKEFMPAEDQSRFLVRLQTPVGSSIEYMDQKTKDAETILQSMPDLKTLFVSVGGFGGGDVNTAVAFVTLKARNERTFDPELKRKPSQADVMAWARKKLNTIPTLRATVQDLSMRSFSSSRGFPVEFSIQGPEWEKMGEFQTQIREALEKTGQVTDMDSDYILGMPEISVVPDRMKAAERGVSIRSIGETLSSLIGGVAVALYPSGGHRYEVRVKLKAPSKNSQASAAERIRSLMIRNNRGELVRLADVVTLQERNTLQQISRKNRIRSVSMFGNLKPGADQQKVLETALEIGKRILPDGYKLVLSGSSESFRETRDSLVFALVLGLLVAYMVLASQFNSFLQPVTVLLSLPFSLTGALLGLWMGGMSLNLYSMIGLILLMGIVKKNSILLVDYSNQCVERGLPFREALLEACPTRLRPILMTSVATIAAALPQALSFGPGSESRSAMAVSVIGGVLLSTVLTLLVVPCFYLVTSRKPRKNLAPNL